jgi:hypothetical protein
MVSELYRVISKRALYCVAIAAVPIGVVAIQLLIVTGDMPSIAAVIRASGGLSVLLLIVAVSIAARSTWLDVQSGALGSRTHDG